jgi:hypothetical protein
MSGERQERRQQLETVRAAVHEIRKNERERLDEAIELIVNRITLLHAEAVELVALAGVLADLQRRAKAR